MTITPQNQYVKSLPQYLYDQVAAAQQHSDQQLLTLVADLHPTLAGNEHRPKIAAFLAHQLTRGEPPFDPEEEGGEVPTTGIAKRRRDFRDYLEGLFNAEKEPDEAKLKVALQTFRNG